VFKPVAMQRLSAVVLERDSRAVLRALGRLGVVHLERVQAGPDTAPLPPVDRAAGLARADAELARIDALALRLAGLARQAPMAGAGGASAQAPAADVSLAGAEAALRALEEKIGEFLARRQDFERRLAQATAMVKQVQPFQGLDVPLDELGASAFFHFAVGTLPPENFEALRRGADRLTVLVPLAECDGRLPLVAATTQALKDQLESRLREARFEHAALYAVQGATAASFTQECREEQGIIAKDLAELELAMADFAAQAGVRLADLRQAVSTERKILEAEEMFPRTEQAVLVTGWSPAESVLAVRQALQDVTRGRCVLRVRDPSGTGQEDVPVQLAHPWILRPFGMILTGYGLPTYGELEPTLFVAISYVVMFGMMFGDGGQGAVLALGGLAAALAGKSAKVRDFGVLLVLLGLSSTAFGVYEGSYFGITKDAAGQFLGHDPLSPEMALPLMAAGIGVGIGIISLGLTLNMINKFRQGDLVGGLLGRFGAAGAVLYWGVLAVAASYAALSERGLLGPVLALVVVLPLAAIILKEPLQYVRGRRRAAAAQDGGAMLSPSCESTVVGCGAHAFASESMASSLAAALLGSIVEVFETVIMYFANTVSFVRLAAYAMSHAAILMATFVIAAEAGRAVGGAGGAVVRIAVIAGGNAMALVLEGTVVLVQALRLEYYEFFSKFLSGSGRAFEPFRISGGGQVSTVPQQ